MSLDNVTQGGIGPLSDRSARGLRFGGRQSEGLAADAGPRVPHFHGIVLRPRDDRGTIAGDRHAVDRTCVPLERRAAGPGPRVPHLHGLVTRPRDDRGTIARDRRDANMLRVTMECRTASSRQRIPNFCRPIHHAMPQR